MDSILRKVHHRVRDAEEALSEIDLNNMDFNNDPNLSRQDRWFAQPQDVLPFLRALCAAHPEDSPEIVSSALLQARKNVARNTTRDALRLETARLLAVYHRWQGQQVQAA